MPNITVRYERLYLNHNYFHVKYSCEIIPPLVSQFVLISYTHKHVLNEITVKTCSNADNKD